MLIDIAAERGVLSGLAKYGSNLFIEIGDILDIECFSKEFNQIIYKCLKQILISSSSVDIPSILSTASQFGLEKVVEGQANLVFLKSLWEYPILEVNVPPLAKRLKKLHIARQCQTRLKQTWEEIGELTGDESVDEIFTKLESPITQFTSELSGSLSTQPKLLFEGASEYVDFLANNPVTQIGYSSPWKQFDEMIGGGFRKQSITCLATRTKVGKSHFLKSVGIHLAQKNVKCLLLDTEMSIESTLHRSLASLTRITINDIECGRFGANHLDRLSLQSKAKEIANLPIYYQSISGKDFGDVLSICKRWILKEVGKNENGEFNDCVIILDYIKLMNVEALKHIAEHQLFGEYLHNLHDFAVKYNIPVVTAIQLNRSGMDKEDLSGISISDRISWLCSNMILMKELSIEEQQELGYIGNIKIMPLATRFGSGLNTGDWLVYKREAQYSLLTEIGKYSELKDRSEGFEANEGDSTEF